MSDKQPPVPPKGNVKNEDSKPTHSGRFINESHVERAERPGNWPDPPPPRKK